MKMLSCASTLFRRATLSRLHITLKTNYTNHKTVPAAYSTVTKQTIHDVNTNVIKDVILYKYENPKFFMFMNMFAIVQYMFWTYLGVFAFSTLKDAPVDRSKVTDETPWFRRINLGENKFRNTLGAISVLIGAGTLSIVWLYTMRSVRYLILHKGGTHVTLVTYSPFGKSRMIKVPLDNVCCKETRNIARVQLPLKVKNQWMHYMLDMKGEFKNPMLFDCTAGLKRKL